MEFTEKTLNSNQTYDGKVVKVFRDDVEIADGHKTFREVVRHSGGVVVLAVKAAKSEEQRSRGQKGRLFNKSILSETPRTGWKQLADKHTSILFVRQYRYPIGKTLLELPAGKLEYSEDPFAGAKRELEEETGYCANKWTDLGYVYTSPGYSDEKLYLYLAEDLEYTHCHPDDGEILEPLELSYYEVIEKIKTGEISDAKTLCAFMRAKLLS